MKDFQIYLLNKHIVLEKTVPYLASWVSRCYAFADKEIGSQLSPADVERFLRSLMRSYETWQVDQAKDAIILYGHF